jgi:hypothetical protein
VKIWCNPRLHHEYAVFVVAAYWPVTLALPSVEVTAVRSHIMIVVVNTNKKTTLYDGTTTLFSNHFTRLAVSARKPQIFLAISNTHLRLRCHTHKTYHPPGTLSAFSSSFRWDEGLIKEHSDTEIDWETYMFHTKQILQGQHNYSLITGPTGALV